MLRKSLLQNAFDIKYVQNHCFEGKCSENHYFKMHLTPNMYKIITLKTNAQENRPPDVSSNVKLSLLTTRCQ